ncbi:class I mannose-6-phosphate isomerase [Microbacterium cremeum]|uniref:class I mannose-6-phosphate isomerase n=1 Tax=Microbacterium cremeum TaxID=2782169 RepID=UPI001889744C|nr:class I mannose-6-phosphate isomerase [Microbacterium cremeum]
MTKQTVDRWAERRARAPHNYDHQPTIRLAEGAAVLDADQFWAALRDAGADGVAPVVAIDTYPGIALDELRAEAARRLPDHRIVDVEAAALPIAEIDALIAPNLTDDRVFGRMSHFALGEFYDADKLDAMRHDISTRTGPVLVIGWGAALAVEEDAVLVLADLARWEIQQRQRQGQPNWRAQNGSEDQLRKYKRSFFVEWRVADRHKRELFDDVDFVLDTNRGLADATALTGDDFRGALAAASRRPFRVVPYFDPGVWGGRWMQELLDLEPQSRNYAWCFDCVPEENSLLFRGADGPLIELPAMDLVLREPRRLLGDRTYARFGAEFPIRFDFLDTMDGGNLSLQVHPLTDYIQQVFGMPYTQDESYYMLDCDDDAVVYLGTKDDVDPDAMIDALRVAQTGEKPFPAEDFVNVFPVRKHDHFPIPAGTVHCSGANSMVLEISATPYIFTFKLWDWGRVGIDGIPRPIHLEHGAANIQWERDTAWVEENLVGRVDVLHDQPGHRIERTGLHELEFIEVQRHWFDRPVGLDTRGTVNVLNLVEGAAATVVSPDGAFAPFQVHYAETFIVPAAVGAYELHPAAGAEGTLGVVVASVRGTEVVAAPTEH